jgi:hypothetical protein
MHVEMVLFGVGIALDVRGIRIARIVTSSKIIFRLVFISEFRAK